MHTQTKTCKRINISLPLDTLQIVDRASREGDRSRLIDAAIRFYIGRIGRAHLKKQLRDGALYRSGRDLQIAQEWFSVENEA